MFSYGFYTSQNACQNDRIGNLNESSLLHTEIDTKVWSLAYETAVDPWSNTIAMEIPSTYHPSLVQKSFSNGF